MVQKWVQKICNKKTFAYSYPGISAIKHTLLIKVNSRNNMTEERESKPYLTSMTIIIMFETQISTNFNFTDIFGKNQKAVMLQ